MLWIWRYHLWSTCDASDLILSGYFCCLSSKHAYEISLYPHCNRGRDSERESDGSKSRSCEWQSLDTKGVCHTPRSGFWFHLPSHLHPDPAFVWGKTSLSSLWRWHYAILRLLQKVPPGRRGSTSPLCPRQQWRADQGSAPNPAPYLKDHILTYTEELSIGCPFPQSTDVAKAVNWTLFICFSGSWNLDILRWEATECPPPPPPQKIKKQKNWWNESVFYQKHWLENSPIWPQQSGLLDNCGNK